MQAQLTRAGHQRIAGAIKAAERATSGEIYCVLARQSGSYFYPAAGVLLVAMLVASGAAALVMESLWLNLRITHFVGLQIAAAGLALLVLRLIQALQIRLVPRRTRYRTAHDNALRQFAGRNVHLTEARTGVLIFVSLAEHYATVIADAGIADKVDQGVWNELIGRLTSEVRAGRLTEGFLGAIGAAGAVLATHFPPAPGDRNELDDHLAEL